MARRRVQQTLLVKLALLRLEQAQSHPEQHGWVHVMEDVDDIHYETTGRGEGGRSCPSTVLDLAPLPLIASTDLIEVDDLAAVELIVALSFPHFDYFRLF